MESPSSADGAGGAIVEAGFGRSDGRAEDHHLPRISVIIPAFNASAFLRPCIDSVLEQTYRDVETIVVDDGSIDNTAEVVSCDIGS